MWRSGEISIQVLLIERSPLLRIKGLFNWSPLHSHYMRVWLRKSRTEWLLKRISALYSEPERSQKSVGSDGSRARALLSSGQLWASNSVSLTVQTPSLFSPPVLHPAPPVICCQILQESTPARRFLLLSLL
jgi:hypothetical protein